MANKTKMEISFENLCYPKQKKLMGTLRETYKSATVAYKKGKYLLIEGDAPVMLVAHLDTVHEEPVKDICKSSDGNVIMSPQGIGGDDRCGVYALMKVHAESMRKPWLLFTCDEEIGGKGADEFRAKHAQGKLPKDLAFLKCIIEIDRKGSKDAVYYDCDNQQFEEYITSKGFVTAHGSFSDICFIAPELGVAAVNLSSGYYNAHTKHEYVRLNELHAVIERIKTIVADSTKKDFPKYEYIKRKYPTTIGTGAYGYGGYDSYYCGTLGDGKKWDWRKDWNDPLYDVDGRGVPRDVPAEYRDMYEKLLWYYSVDDLEYYRLKDGDDVIWKLYEDTLFDDYGLPKDLPEKYRTMYNELLDLYPMEDLEWFRSQEGDKVIEEIYREEFMPNGKDASDSDDETKGVIAV